MKKSKRGEEEAIIQLIEVNYDRDLEEQKFQALKRWVDSVGDKATVFDLDCALRQHNCASVADKHTAGFVNNTAEDTSNIATKPVIDVGNKQVVEPLITSKVVQQETTGQF